MRVFDVVCGTAAHSGNTVPDVWAEQGRGRSPARHAPARPAGATLSELLVTLTIAALLLALLIPAVGSTRAAARRLQCQQHLRQLSLALHQYHATCGAFPYGVTGGWGHSWSTYLLPFTEQASLAATVPWSDHGWWRGGDRNSRALQALARTRLPLFRCPAQPAPVTSDLNQLPGRFVTSYLACAGGDARHDNHGAGGMSRSNGVIRAADFLDTRTGPARPHRLADVLDGASNTLLLSEARFLAHDPAVCGTCDRFYLYHPNADTRSGSDFSEALGSSYYPINTRSRREAEQECAFSSYHAGGVMAALVDGSTRPFTDAIDLALWRHLGSIHD